MQNETHYTEQDRKVTSIINVFRKFPSAKVATIRRVHGGWKADLGAGIRRVYATKAEAFAAAVNADTK